MSQASERKELKQILAIFAVLLLVPLLDQLLTQNYQITPQMPPVLIFAIVSLGLTVVTGFTGQLHLGMAAFIAVGAYSFAIASSPIYPFQFGFWISCLVALAVGGFVGLLLGIPTLRLRGDYLAIVTLGFGEIIQDILRNLDIITKGTQGINPIPSPNLFGLTISSDRYTLWYYLALAILALITFIVRRLEESHIGRAWMAVRDDELAATCMRLDAVEVKLSAFALGAAFAALAGGLMTALLGSSGEPSNYDFQVSIIALSTIIVGGIGSVPGALVGALAMMGLNSIVLPKVTALFGQDSGSFVSNPSNWKYLLFGAALVIMMRWKREGLIPPAHKTQET